MRARRARWRIAVALAVAAAHLVLLLGWLHADRLLRAAPAVTPRVAVRVRSRRAFSCGERVSSLAPRSSFAVASVRTAPLGDSSNRSAANPRAGVRRNSTEPSPVIASGAGTPSRK